MARSIGQSRGRGHSAQPKKNRSRQGVRDTAVGKERGGSRKPQRITTVMPVADRTAELLADPDIEDVDADFEEANATGEVEEEDTDFSEDAEEYDEGTDPDGDFSEPAPEESLGWYDSMERGQSAEPSPDLEIVLYKEETSYTADVLAPAATQIGRFHGSRSSRAIEEMEEQILRLEEIGKLFVEEMQDRWGEFLDPKLTPLLASAGRLFRLFRQERVAEELGIDAGVLSRFRENYTIRMPRFGVVSLGELFEAAARGDVELAAFVVRGVLASGQARPNKKQVLGKICAALQIGERMARNRFNQAVKEGLVTWPKAKR